MSTSRSGPLSAALLSAVVLITCPVVASAAPVVWTFTGEITSAQNAHSMAGLTTAVGDAFTVALSLDPALPSNLVGDTRIYDQRITRVDLTIGSNSLTLVSPPASQVSIQNNAPIDVLSFFASNLPLGATVPGRLNLQLDFFGSGATLPSADFPSLFTLAAWSGRSFLIRDIGVGGFDDTRGIVTDFSATSVPLPAGAWLLLSGLCALAVGGRRPRRGGASAPRGLKPSR